MALTRQPLGVALVGITEPGGQTSGASIALARVLDFTALLSSLAKHASDLSALLGSASGLSGGQTTTQGRIAALADFGQLSAVLGGFGSFFTAESALIARAQTLTSLTGGVAHALLPLCVALETDTGGLDSYLTINSLQVPTAYASVHNACALLSDHVRPISASNINGSLMPTY